MTKKTMRLVKRASDKEKRDMQDWIDAENSFQKKEPQGIYYRMPYDKRFPIEYRLERVSGAYQATAYTPEGEIYEGHAIGFYRCPRCGKIMDWGGEDIVICGECWWEMEAGY